MAGVKLTKRTADAVGAPGIYWDAELPGFGLRIHPSGQKAWVIQYRAGRRTRRLTVGGYPPVTPAQARTEAARLLAEVHAHDRDPSLERRLRREALTVQDLADRYEQEHLAKNKPKTQTENRRLLARHVLPALGRYRVADVTAADVSRLHASLGATPVLANRVLFLVSTLMNLAERWHLRPRGSNPARDAERFREAGRERFLSEVELHRLGRALDALEADEPAKVAAVRLLLFTGCRRGEVLGLRWEDVNLERGLLLLPDSKTGRRPVLLSEPAREILARLPRRHPVYVFPGPRGDAPLREVRKFWQRVLTEAGLRDLHLHDLRHTFGSHAAMDGVPLYTVGTLLGHSHAETTRRYAHLGDDPLRAASEAIGARLAAALEGRTGEVIPLAGRGPQR